MMIDMLKDGWTVMANKRPKNGQNIRGFSQSSIYSEPLLTCGTYKNGNYYVDGRPLKILLWQQK